jgi:hypothetical protein
MKNLALVLWVLLVATVSATTIVVLASPPAAVAGPNSGTSKPSPSGC